MDVKIVKIMRESINNIDVGRFQVYNFKLRHKSRFNVFSHNYNPSIDFDVASIIILILSADKPSGLDIFFIPSASTLATDKLENRSEILTPPPFRIKTCITQDFIFFTSPLLPLSSDFYYMRSPIGKT